MTPAETDQILGKPDSVRREMIDGIEIEVRVHQRFLGSRMDMTSPTLEEEPWIDPITNELKQLKVPSSTPQRTDQIEEITLYFSSGQLAEVRSSTFTRRSFSQ